ncbi:hypothetical protein ABFV47_25170 [Mycolicibacterium fortuitum]
MDGYDRRGAPQVAVLALAQHRAFALEVYELGLVREPLRDLSDLLDRD